MLLALVTLGLPVQAQTQTQTVRSLQSMDFVALDGDRVLLTLTMSSTAPEPVVFAIDKPARLSIDLPDTTLALLNRYRKVNVGLVRSVAAAEAKGRSRIVVEMNALTPHTVRVDGNKIYLELAGLTGALSSPTVARPLPPQTSTTVAPAMAPARAAASSAPAQGLISNIDFRRGEKGEGRVIVSLGDTRNAVDVREEGGKIVVRFKNTSVPERLAKRFDVLDFATPVKFIDASRDGANAQLIVTPIAAGDFEQVAYQSGNVFTLELQPISQEKLDERRRLEPQYTGEKISLSFQSIDVRSLLQIIADVAQTNMVVSDSVTGQIAMRLQNVPWDQALDIILRTKGLGQRKSGNVILVAPLDELAQREKADLENEKQKVQLAALRSEIIQVNYAKASELASLIKSKDNSVLSERGSVTVDERTNTMLVLETRDKLGEIRALVQRLDIPVRQVLIESRIVVARSNFDREFGARFGFSGNRTRDGGNGGLISTSGSGEGTNTSLSGSPTGLPSIGGSTPAPRAAGAIGDRYNVNLPVANPAGSIALAILGRNSLIDLELSALQSEGKGEVISSPRVITANGKQAAIEQGREIPFQNATSSGATAVQFKKAVLSLNVTPQITPDNRVIMDLAVTNDSQGTDVAQSGGGSAPAIDTRKVTTQVLVDNGQTVVLGGIYEQTSNDSVTKVPLLGDIPVLGVLFRNKIKIQNKTELLIFITPKILSEGLKVN
ncbi:type IV pilus secretin PilQ [uncultured Nevskia sp.]|uniref:type IV pilus secretin PilQ n=1 Tax=uncultured Nevskia sp. TaxID=228950 RepID=UPI0025F95479|nr:type IV pilus secretin PilQ [uncultured Nevskia sp.]